MNKDEHYFRELEDSRQQRPGAHRAFCAAVDEAVEFSRLSADEQLLYEAILRVVDDERFELYQEDRWSTTPTGEPFEPVCITEDKTNEQRIDLARKVIERFRKFRFEDDEERIARR
jgi:hypothetical protein